MSTPNMNLVLPVDHGSQDVWDTILDTVFTTIDSHDHTTGQGVKIPSAALNINADVSFATSSITNLRALDFIPLATSGVTSYAGALFCNSADNELYWRTTGGTNVKLTAGASLNVAAFVGGIGGDYSAVGALLSFDDATDSYWLQQQGAPRPWAGMRVGNLDIYQQAALIVNRVRIMSPAALAASYALTLPAALGSLAGVQRPLNVDSTGQLTIGEGTRQYSYSAAGFSLVAASSTVFDTATGGAKYTAGSTTMVIAINGLENGRRIISFETDFIAAGVVSITYSLNRRDSSGVTVLASGSSIVAGYRSQVVVLGSPNTVQANANYYVIFGAANVNDVFLGVQINTDFPA